MIYQVPYRRFAIIIILIISVILGGTVGYHLIEKWSLIESFYMTVITISTVGFAEVAPLSHFGRIFTVILIMTGVVIITTGVSLIFSSVIEGTFGEIMRRQRMEKKLAKMKNHFIICGSGVVGEDVMNEFIRAQAPFVIIEKNADVLTSLLKKFPDTINVNGDATDDEILKKAGIEQAKGIIAVLGNDADNLFICVTARALNPHLRIIARAIVSEAINKLKRAGADYVFSPEKIGGVRLAAAALKPTVTSFLDAVLKGEYLNLVLDEVEVQKDSSIVDKTLKETNISKDIGIIIVALKSAVLNKLNFNPSSDTKINSGDVLISFGTPEQIGQLRKVCRASMKIL
ncbi:MAG: potassium channel protein [candidate division WOR-3 bacterium]|nr:MAG: potassium channel protein [candidate division WOR-3 bacterium]